MPQIDQLVDATVGHPWMSFLDAFQGYHQIPLAADDQEKTAFVTPIGNYHYKVVPFGLKNARSTYQRMMTRMFEPQLGKSIEVYIDDMVVKSKVVSKHVRDLKDIFEILKRHKLRRIQMFIWGRIGKILGLYGDLQGDRGQSQSNQRCQQLVTASESQRGPKAYRYDCCLKPFYFPVSRQVQTLLPLDE